MPNAAIASIFAGRGCGRKFFTNAVRARAALAATTAGGHLSFISGGGRKAEATRGRTWLTALYDLAIGQFPFSNHSFPKKLPKLNMPPGPKDDRLMVAAFAAKGLKLGRGSDSALSLYYRRKCAVSSCCPICGLEEETVERALLLCKWVREVWFACPLSLKIDAFSVSRFDVWCLNWFENKEIDEKGLLLVASICWEVWKARCEFIFQGVQVNPMKCCVKACSAVMEICGLGKAHLRPFLKPVVADFVPKCWIPPCKDSVKVNFNGAFNKDSLDARVGFLVRDMDGDMWMGYSGKVFASSSLVCEALALKMAISKVDCLPDLKFIFEMDCEVLFNLVTNSRPYSGDWLCEDICGDIARLASSLQNLSFSLVRRNGNQAVNWLAKSALKGLAPSGWVINPPPPLARLLALDREFTVKTEEAREGIC
ncbi:reverse transcriptase [Senna tora]|uniref:Reverse transcriptase n=1 Tax=Senna tora TaxID=362788 RepID=A0A834WMS8_9FABA|nr:reverse transcriptase [Senna tora]